MKALLIDDERIARQELRRLLAAHPEIEIAGEAQNGEQAFELTSNSRRMWSSWTFKCPA